MKKQNLALAFIITNSSNKNVFLWPHDEELKREWGLLIKADCFISCDYRFQGLDYAIDFNECYFQFEGMKRKIKYENAAKYGIEVEIIE